MGSNHPNKRAKAFARRAIFAGAASIALVAITPPTLAQRADAGFGQFAGSWVGAGTISTTNGSERIRCRVNYGVTAGGARLHQDLRCASDSYNIQVASDIVNQGGAELLDELALFVTGDDPDGLGEIALAILS